jgi:hypothetical protein
LPARRALQLIQMLPDMRRLCRRIRQRDRTAEGVARLGIAIQLPQQRAAHAVELTVLRRGQRLDHVQRSLRAVQF